MDMNNEKLQRFIDAVNDETERKVREMLEEAEEEKKEILSEAENGSEEFEAGHFSSGSRRNGYTRDVSRAEMEMKKEVLIRREALTDEIFAAVKERLIAYRSDPGYVDILIKYLADVSDGAEIFLAPEDMKYADKLRKAVTAGDVVFSPDEKIKLGGMSIYDKSRGTISDKTFDLAVEEQRRLFANSGAFAQ